MDAGEHGETANGKPNHEESGAEQGGLLGHLQAHLGPVRDVESVRSPEGAHPFDLATYYDDSPGFRLSSVVSNGLRFHPITAMRPQEMICTLRGEQQHVARHLVGNMAMIVLKHMRGFEYGFVIRNDEPIVEGTEIRAVLGHTSPYFGEDFNLFRDESGEIVLQLVTLLPITGPEADLVRQEGPDTLAEVFHLNRTNILDVTRPSAV